MDIIEKLNKLRFERNMSVYRLSEVSGINQSTLANTFSRGVIPSLANLESICNALGITLAQFFNENEKEFFLTEEETEMLLSYRKLSLELKKSIGNTISCIADNLQK